MKKVNITLAFDEDKLDALEFSLKKENSSVQSRMEDALQQLYEKTVPEPVREYLESLGIFAEILETRAGGVISSHCGPGTLGVLFISVR